MIWKKEDLHEVDWVKEQTKSALSSLQKEVLYTKNGDEVKFDVDTSLNYLKTLKDKKTYSEVMKNNPWATVMAVQILLKNKGYNIGKIDWILRTQWKATSKTMEAIAKFQRENWLTDDGAPGPDTIKKILAIYENWWNGGWNADWFKKRTTQSVGEFKESYSGFYSSGPDLRRLEEMPVTKDVENFSLGDHVFTIDGFPELNKKWKDGEKITGDIYIAFWAWTDWTPCRNPSKRFNKIEFEKKKEEIIDFISNSRLNNYDKDSIIRLVRGCDFWTRGPKKLLFSNEWLLWMRNLECIRWIIESFNKSSINSSNVRLVLAYDSEMNQAWITKDEKEERFAHINVRYRKPEESLDWYRETRK